MKKFMHLALFTLFFLPLMAQSRKDTLQLSLVQADSLLIRNNLSLIAATYEVDASRAQIIQARLFSNPVLSGELSLYNPVKEKWFDVGPTGIGSESQKPLAIVIIGGLITATVLILLIFPIVYWAVYRHTLEEKK